MNTYVVVNDSDDELAVTAEDEAIDSVLWLPRNANVYQGIVVFLVAVVPVAVVRPLRCRS